MPIFAHTPDQSPSADTEKYAKQATDAFLTAFGDHAGFRLFHAKGLVVQGFFDPAKSAANICKAAHFRGGPFPVIARFSNATGVPDIPDFDPNSNPKGFAIRFGLPNNAFTDIVANGLPGFAAATPADFVAFLQALITTAPNSPHPTPLEKFVGSHPATLAYVSKPNPTPASFATQAFFGNSAFIFTNAQGQRVATRYQIIPIVGEKYLDAAAASAKSPNFLFDEIKDRLGKCPVEYRLLAQVAEPSDPTNDATKIWPDDRKKVELGTIRLTSVDPKSADTEKTHYFDPGHLIEGIEFSDDPLLPFRTAAYSISIEHRRRGSGEGSGD